MTQETIRTQLQRALARQGKRNARARVLRRVTPKVLLQLRASCEEYVAIRNYVFRNCIPCKRMNTALAAQLQAAILNQ